MRIIIQDINEFKTVEIKEDILSATVEEAAKENGAKRF